MNVLIIEHGTYILNDTKNASMAMPWASFLFYKVNSEIFYL